MLKYFYKTLALTFILASVNAGEIPKKPGDKLLKVKPGSSLSYVIKNNKMVGQSTTQIPSSHERILVQLKAPSLTQAKNKIGATRKSFAANALQLEAEHKAFAQQLSSLTSNAVHARYEYRSVFNGVALTIPTTLRKSIGKLPQVLKIFPDRTVQANDVASNAVIGAPAVWAQPGVTGRGQVIAIIDTGIDYRHSTLGGGIGPQFKVIGGHDFANNDNDPIDDHYHGTHVAGIAAGIAPLAGVAPDARLLAVKVLDAEGAGYYSDVIAGMEYSVDPDGNPNTDDGADVINMSLGGPGQPDEPLALAADAAMSRGVVVVAAAGNSGPDWQTINSPGVAPSIITVGASDNVDAIADFSSRGPAFGTDTIKPDLLAPGVDIDSALIGGGSVQLSGTSMAAPHVAGAAALLKELHPQWTSADIKSALVNGAIDLAQSVWMQGAGRLDLRQAVKVSSAVMPSSINFGMVDLSAARWSQTRTVQLKNTATTTQDYQLSVDANTGTGISITLSPSTARLTAGAQITLTLQVDIDNALAAPGTGDIPGIYGAIKIDSAAQDLRVPFAVIRSTSLSVDTDADTTSYVVIHDRRGNVISRVASKLTETFFLPAGSYDVMVNNYTTDTLATVIKENVSLSTATTINGRANQAIHTLNMDWRDENNQPLNSVYTSTMEISHKASGAGFGLIGAGYANHKVSDMSSAYGVSGFNLLRNAGKPYDFYNIPFAVLNGLHASQTITTPIASYRHVQHRIRAPKNVKSQRLVFSMTGTTTDDTGWSTSGIEVPCGFGAYEYYLYPALQCIVPNPAIVTGHYLPQVKADAFLRYLKFDLWDAESIGRLAGDPLSGFASATVSANGNLNFFRSQQHVEPENITDTHTVRDAGRFLPVFAGSVQATDNELIIVRDRFAESLFMDAQGNSTMSTPLPYMVKRGNETLAADTLTSYLPSFEPISIAASAGPRQLTLTYTGYRVSDQAGRATVQVNIEQGQAPTLKKLMLQSNGKYADILLKGNVNRVAFDVDFAAGMQQLSLDIRRNGQASWTPLTVSANAGEFNTLLPDDLSDGLYDMRVTAVNSDGNALNYLLEPAFVMTSNIDRDGDGILDLNDAFPDDGREWLDGDLDGVGNVTDADDDSDGMPDLWELAYKLNPDNADDAVLDSDNDLISNLDEYKAGSDPRSVYLTAAIPDQNADENSDVELDMSGYFHHPAGDDVRHISYGLPPGLYNTYAGVIVGRTAYIGEHIVTLIATNGSTVAETQFKLIINDINFAPQASGIPSQSATAGELFSFNAASYFSDADGDDLQFSAGDLPTGVTINAQGTLSGKPAQAGTYDITITASDGQEENLGTLRLHVAQAPGKPQRSDGGGGSFAAVMVLFWLSIARTLWRLRA